MRAIIVGPFEFNNQEQGFDRGLRDLLFGRRQLLDIFRGILKGDELAASWQWNQFVETALPSARHQANRSAPACVNFT